MVHPLSSLSRRLGTAAAVVAAVLILSPTPVAAQLQVATAGDTCASSASETEINDGLQIVSDFRCLTEGGDGCFDGICRYCKSESTDKYPNYVLCEQLAGGNQDFGVSTDPPNPLRDSTHNTLTQNNLGGYGVCPSRIGDEEFAQGIQLVGDANCGGNKDGCFNDQCRYCKFSETTKSSQYVTCNSLGYSFDPASAPVPVSATSDTAPSLPEPVPVDVPAPVEPLVFANAPTPAPGPDQLPSDPSASVLAPALQPTDTPATLSSTGCPYAVTSGDFDVGIQLVGDSSCLAGGGVGCFQNACRYCRFGVPTPQSSEFVTCADLGYNFDTISPTTSRSGPPTLALSPSIVVDSPLVATSDPPPNPSGTPAPTQVTNSSTDCAFVVSEGDFAAGIQLVGDETCAGGGRGCFQDVCRFCKFRNTPQSRHMVPCGDLGYPQFGTPGPTNNSDTGCPYDVSTGDAAVGINLVGDASCATATGGLGCFESVCRYCKEWDTPQSKHLLDCADLMAEQTYPPAWRPAEVADPTASTDAIEPAHEPGGVDQTPTPNATDPIVAPVPSNAIPSVVLVVPNTISPAPTKSVRPTRPPLAAPKTTRPAATIKPSTVKPVATAKPAATTRPVIATKPLVIVKPKTRTPAATRMASSGTGCAFAASHSDIAAGVQLVVDTTCARGGIGCFGNSCRYCKFRKTKRSKQFVACASLGFHFGSVQSTATATAVRTHKPTRAPSLPHVATAAPLRSTDCPFVVSDGDFAVGIKLVGDASCANGGLGCFQGVCRYCKFKETPQSAHWVRCADYTVVPPSMVVAAAPPPPLTPQPTALLSVAPIVINPTPATAVEAPVAGGTYGVPILPSETDVTQASCDEAVAIEDVIDGIDVVPDRLCLGGGSSCIPNSACRYCMRWVTEASQGLIPCDDIPPVLVAVQLASEVASAENPFNQLLTDKAFQSFIVVAACVGVVAVAALTVVGAKRTVTRCGSILVGEQASTKRAAAMSSKTSRLPESHPTVVTVEDGKALATIF